MKVDNQGAGHPVPAFPSELTELGEQFLIPGCEKRPTPGTKGTKATGPDLWDAASDAGRP